MKEKLATRRMANCFHSYDIRGVIGEEIVLSEVSRLGCAIARFFDKKTAFRKIIIGYDTRSSSVKLFEKICKGISFENFEVVSIEQSMTSMVRFGCRHTDVDGGIMITASHRESGANGFKIFDAKGSSIGEEGIRKIYKEFLKTREKKFKKIPHITYEKSIRDMYIETLKDFALKNLHSLAKDTTIIWDCAYGGVSRVVPEFVKSINCINIVVNLAEGQDFEKYNETHPSCRRNSCKSMARLIAKHKADFGFVFDCDGDRVVTLDNLGSILSVADLLPLMLEGKKNQKIVVDAKVDFASLDKIKDLNGRFVVAKCGYPFILKKMQENDIPYGFEQSFHFFFKEFEDGIDDGVFSAYKIISGYSRSNKKMSWHRSIESKSYILKPERWRIKSRSEARVIMHFIAQIIKDSGWNVFVDNGVRVNEKNFWFLLRLSQTEEYIYLFGEVKNKRSIKVVRSFVELMISHVVQVFGKGSVGEISDMVI